MAGSRSRKPSFVGIELTQPPIYQKTALHIISYPTYLNIINLQAIFSKVHPHEPMFAVAEKGDNPPILFYSWPDLEVKKVLRDGAASEFNNITFR